MTRILIAEAHEVTRWGLRILIEARSGWRVCAEARTGPEAIDYAAALQPEVGVLDIDLEEMNGLEAARRIRRAAPKVKLLVVTAHNNERSVQDFIEIGARGYVLKSDAGRSIVDAIEAIVKGYTFFSERLQPMIEPRDTFPNQTWSNGHLTPREREVLTLLSTGQSNKAIGGALRISTKTAETHRANLMQKLQAHSLAALVRYAIRNGIVAR